MKNKTIQIFIIFILIIGKLEANSAENLTILFIFSWNKDIPWQKEIEAGFKKTLKKQNISNNLFYEYMDGGRFNEDSQINNFHDYLIKKYKAKSIDHVVCESEIAARLFINNPDLFKNSQKIFLNPGYESKRIKQDEKHIFIPINIDFDKIVQNLINTTKARTIYLVAGETSKKRVDAISNSFSKIKHDRKIELLVGLPMEQLLHKVSRLKPNSIIVYLLLFQDGKGAQYVPYDAAIQISKHASVPVYSFWTSLLGSGIVGGYMLDGEKVGVQAATIIIKPQRLKNRIMISMDNYHQYFYDWRQLKRWGIDMKKLPVNSKIMFKEYNFFELYYLELLAFFAVFLLIIVVYRNREIYHAHRKLEQLADELIKQKEELVQFERTLNQTVDCVFIFSADDYKFTYVNKGAINQVGYSDKELLQMTPLDIKPLFNLENFNKLVTPLLSGQEQSIIFQTMHRHKHGHDIPVEIILQFDSTHGDHGSFFAIVRDITEIKLAYEKIAQNEIFLHSIINSVEEPLMVIGTDYQILIMNEQAKSNIPRKYSRENSIFCYQASHGSDAPCTTENHGCPIKEVIKTGRSYSETHIHQDSNGQSRYIDILASPIFDTDGSVKAVVELNRDITDYILAQQNLQKALNDKEVLIKEVHHRVKNNLAVIQSLLSFQSSQSKDHLAKQALDDSQSRVEAMSMIHEKLYKSKNISTLDFSDYISSLANQLYENYCTKKQDIVIKVDIPKIDIDIDTIIPCGLIVNEILTNAFKYAFPHNSAGEIVIAVEYDENNQILLIVKDNGVGLPKGFNVSSSDSLGMRIIKSLSLQIGSDIQIFSQGKGTTFKIVLIKANSKKITWSDTHNSLGHTVLDKQHKQLYCAMEELQYAIESGRHEYGLSIVPSILQYADEHFKTEEKIMRDYKYSDYESHKKNHQYFIEEIQNMISKIQNEQGGLSLSICNFLMENLINHIWNMDMKLGIFMKERGIIFHSEKEKYQILLIEDDILVQKMMGGFIEKCGYNYLVSSNGLEAIDLVKKNDFELILSDVMLPGMSGIETIEKIRMLQVNSPVIFLTGREICEISEQTKDLNVLNIFAKPVSFAKLKKILLEFIAKS